MLKLENEILLYHGSYTEVSQIDLKKCKNGLDFGRGFYVTSSFSQARNYVPSSVRKAIAMKKIPENFDVAEGRINIYRFHFDSNLFIHYFEDAGLEWLHFVAANRDRSLFPKLVEKFKTTDIIGGKVADDNTARTLNFYTEGAWGQPGTPEVDELTLKALLPNRLKDQFCFRSLDAVASLEFVRSERYGDSE